MTLGDERLPDQTMLDAVADHAFDRIASLVRAMLGVPVALVSLVDRYRQVFPGQSGLTTPLDELRTTPLTHSFCQHVVQSEAAVVVPDAREDPRLAQNLAIADYGFIGYAGAPLTDFDGTVIGSLCAIDFEPHPWTASEISLLTDLAAACSAELQLRTAAARADRAKRDTEILLQLAETLSESQTIEQITTAVRRVARDRIGALSAGVGVLDDDTAAMSFIELVGASSERESGQRRVAMHGHVPSRSVFATGVPLFFSDRERVRADYPDAAVALGDIDGEAYACLPLTMNFRTIGTLGLVWTTAHSFDAGEQALLRGVARHTALAVHRARLLEDLTFVAETLQAAVTPALPHVDGITMAGCCLPSRSRNLVGGDWYDAFEGPDGQVLVTIGDVQGHDIQAAAVMGRIRSALTSLAIVLEESPAGIYRALDRVLASLQLERRATGILAALEPAAAGTSLSWSNAGHPAPVVLVAGEPARYLDAPLEPALGLESADLVRATHTMLLAPDSIVLLYTNGLLHDGGVGDGARDDSPDSQPGTQSRRLLESVERHRHLSPADLVDAVIGDWLDSTDHQDDVALLAIQVD